MQAVRQALTALLFFVVAGFVTPAATGQDAITNRVATLEERLLYGLKARTIKERAFIKAIVNLVNTGQLDQKLVDQAFFWVQKEIEKKKKGDPTARKHIQKYPFFYFKQVLKLNAKRAKTPIPENL